MNKIDYNALIEEAKNLTGKDVVVKKHSYDKDGQTYIFKRISKGLGIGFKDEEMDWTVDALLQLKDGEQEVWFPLQIVVRAIKENNPIITERENRIIKRKINL
jgi:hypothetical protein